MTCVTVKTQEYIKKKCIHEYEQIGFSWLFESGLLVPWKYRWVRVYITQEKELIVFDFQK